VAPEPRKRPRSSYRRFAAAQPNECWQSDFTHWRLADGTDTEILNFLDDHSRYLLGWTAHTPVTGDQVTSSFLAIAEEHGLPASTLTDNGRVYTARFGGGKNAFEYLLAALGITQKNGHPGHPQTQGKIERLHQTLKNWLVRQPAAASLADLQAQLDTFAEYYNHQRPHRGIGRRTPATAWTARPGHCQPGKESRSATTSASAKTASTATANSPSATTADCTTSASDTAGPAPTYSCSSANSTSASSPKKPAN
jgi:transposase InsO family protein